MPRDRNLLVLTISSAQEARGERGEHHIMLTTESELMKRRLDGEAIEFNDQNEDEPASVNKGGFRLRCVTLFSLRGRGASIKERGAITTHKMLELHLVEDVPVLSTPDGSFILASHLSGKCQCSDNTIKNWCKDSIVVSRDSAVLRLLR